MHFAHSSRDVRGLTRGPAKRCTRWRATLKRLCSAQLRIAKTSTYDHLSIAGSSFARREVWLCFASSTSRAIHCPDDRGRSSPIPWCAALGSVAARSARVSGTANAVFFVPERCAAAGDPGCTSESELVIGDRAMRSTPDSLKSARTVMITADESCRDVEMSERSAPLGNGGMSHDEPTSDELQRLRETGKARLSQRNWLAAIATIVAAPVPIIDAASGATFHTWTILFPLLAGGGAMLLWQLNPWKAAAVRCPACGEHWEHDEFLGWSQCEKCGLRLSARAE